MVDIQSSSTEATHSSSPRVQLAVCAVLTSIVMALGIISFQMGDWPWNFHWFDGIELDSVVKAVVKELRFPLAAVGLFGFFWCGWIFRPNIDDGTESLALAVNEGDPEHIHRELAAHVATEGVDVLLEPDCAQSEAKIATLKKQVSQLTQENREYKEQFAAIDATRSSFLSTISHELRTPMNGIIGMSELLQAANLTPREKGYVNTIHSSAESLMHSLSDILDYTRLSSGELSLENALFDLHECVEDVCEMLAGAAHNKGLELVCHVDTDVPVMVEGDHNRLRQILNHLVSNAISFTEQGDVVVRLSRKSLSGKRHTLKFDIEDTGVGIAPEMQMRLFEAFSQADATTTRSHEGLGLGLAVSRRLIVAMNGAISFRSRMGEGTCFTFTVDLLEIASDTGSAKRPMLNGAKVLLVDDNDANRTILNHQLAQWGVITVDASSGQGALTALYAARDNGDEFDAMILDMHMPEMDGLTLAKAIHDDDSLPKLPAMLLTSAVVDANAEELASIGIDKFISKPARQSLLRTSLLSLIPYSNSGKAFTNESSDGSYTYIPVEAAVLLVEDNKISQDVTVGLLESFGCSVEIVLDGREAVKRCENKLYDIVFMDCELPEMSGFEATAAIRSIPSLHSTVRIVAVTALAMEGDREKCLQSGMDDYLSKPLHQDQLYATLMRWCADRLVVQESDENEESQETPEASETQGSNEGPDGAVGAEGTEHNQKLAKTVISATPQRDGFVTKPLATIDEDFRSGPQRGGQVSRPGAIVNTSALDAISGLQRSGNTDLLGKVINLYFEKSPPLVNEINTCKTDGDQNSIQAAAHTLKSSSAYLGAEELASLCKQFEVAIKYDDTEQLAPLATRISEVYEEVEDFLQQYIQQRKAA